MKEVCDRSIPQLEQGSKRPDATYPLQAPAGVCLSAGTTFCIWCRQGDYPEQLEGATFYGLTATLKGEINIQNGQIVQSNFDDYLVLKSRTLRNLTYICWKIMKLREDLAKPEPH